MFEGGDGKRGERGGGGEVGGGSAQGCSRVERGREEIGAGEYEKGSAH